jgi:hypothetical protein
MNDATTDTSIVGMIAVSVEIARYIDDSFPGFVECRLVDALGREWLFHEKVPVVTRANLDASSSYPQPGVIACKVVEGRQQSDGRGVVNIDTEIPWHVESTTGETRFEVYATQLTNID